MIELDDDEDQTSGTKQKFWKITKEKSIMNSIFELYSKLYYKKNYEENNNLKQKAELIFDSTVWCIQVVSLLWIPELPIEDWSENMIIWETIGYFRLDNICSEVGLISACLTVLILCTLIISLVIMILVFMIYHSCNVPDFIFRILKLFMYLWATFLIIPSMELLTIFLKYNFWPQNHISEYKNNTGIGNYEISAWLQVIIAIVMVISFPLLFFYTEFSADIRHFMSNKTIFAKAHSLIDRHIAVFNYFFPIIYVIFAQDYIIYLQVFVMIIFGLLMVETLKYLPYFSQFSNRVLILRLFFISFMSFCFILGYLADNSLAISFIAVILGPFLAVITIRFVPNLLDKASIPNSLKEIITQYDLEKAFRPALCKSDTENKSQIVHMFEAFFIENPLKRAKLQAIWIANYCFYTLRDESLAKIKLSKVWILLDWCLETNYQEYLCSQVFSTSCFGENTQFSNYFQRMSMIKRKDKKLCANSIGFLDEMTSPYPDLKKLKKYLSGFACICNLLNTEYNYITTKYSNMRESLFLYSTYARYIIYDDELATRLDYKLKSLSKIATTISDTKDFSYFNENNGVIMFSSDPANLGSCLFRNEKAVELYNLSVSDVIGDNVFNLIHPYYRERATMATGKYITFSPCSDLNFEEGFFVHVPAAGGLLECVGKVAVGSMNSLFVGLIVFKLKQANHQIAWLTDNREIISYTSGFPKMIKKPNYNLEGCNIKHLFSDLREDLELNRPYKLSNFEKETYIIFGNKDFYGMDMPYAMLTDDNEEIKKWKNEVPENKNILENLEPNSSLCLMNSHQSILKNFESQRQENIYLDSTTNLFQSSNDISFDVSDKLLPDNNDDEKSNKSEYSARSKYTDTIKKSSRSTNILHIAFGLTYLVILCVSTAILFYAYYKIKLISDMDLSIAVGKAGLYFQGIGLISKTLSNLAFIDKQYADPIAKAYWQDIDFILVELDKLSWNLTLIYENWDCCSSRSILSDQNINLYYLDNKNYNQKYNLLETVNEFMKITKEFKTKMNNSEDSKYEIAFLLINGYGEAFQYCNRSLYEIVDCQKSMVSDFKIKIFTLLGLSPAILGICIFLLLPFYYSVVKIENTLWNNLRIRAYTHYYEIKKNLTERLKTIHSESEIMTNNQKHTKDPRAFKSLWKYIWRAALLVIAVVIFSLINIFYLYDKCADYLYYRPVVIKELINQQMLYTTFSIWATESTQENYGWSSAYVSPYFYPFSTSKKEFIETKSNLEKSDSIMRKKKFSSILSQKFIEMYYEHYDLGTESFALGIYSFKELVEFDDYYISDLSIPLDQWLDIMLTTRELGYYYILLIDEIEKHSKSLIDNQIILIIATLAIFIVCLLVLYFGFYLTFFRSEKVYLQKIDAMIKILPQ